MSHHTQLIQGFASIGITVSEADIPKILKMGIDGYLLQMHHVPQAKEDFAGLYIALNELRSTPTTSHTNHK